MYLRAPTHAVAAHLHQDHGAAGEAEGRGGGGGGGGGVDESGGSVFGSSVGAAGELGGIVEEANLHEWSRGQLVPGTVFVV